MPKGPKSKVSKAIEGMSDDVEELKSSKKASRIGSSKHELTKECSIALRDKRMCDNFG